MKWVDKDLTELMTGKKRPLDSFSRLAEVMVQCMIGKLYADDVTAAFNILALFNLAITVDRFYSYRVAHYYVEATLERMHTNPSYHLSDIDTTLLNAAMQRARWQTHYQPGDRQHYRGSNNSNSDGSDNNKAGPCRLYNNGRCRFPKCKFRHICSNCLGDHPATSTECKNNNKKKNNNRSRSTPTAATPREDE